MQEEEDLVCGAGMGRRHEWLAVVGPMGSVRLVLNVVFVSLLGLSVNVLPVSESCLYLNVRFH